MRTRSQIILNQKLSIQLRKSFKPMFSFARITNEDIFKTSLIFDKDIWTWNLTTITTELHTGFISELEVIETIVIFLAM